MDRSYGARLRTRRELLGLSQRALAAAAGVAQPLVSAIESGRRQATAAAAAALDEQLVLRPSVALARRRAEVADAVRRYGGHDAVVFGSVALGTDAPGSDLDLMVAFEPGRDIVDLLALEAELQEILTVPVDVVSAGSTGPVARRARAEAVAL